MCAVKTQNYSKVNGCSALGLHPTNYAYRFISNELQLLKSCIKCLDIFHLINNINVINFHQIQEMKKKIVLQNPKVNRCFSKCFCLKTPTLKGLEAQRTSSHLFSVSFLFCCSCILH